MSALFVVRIADLDAGPQRLAEPLQAEWLTRSLVGTDAVPWTQREGSSDVGAIDLTVTKNGRQILVRGKARAYVTLPCARTLDPAHYELDASVFLLLTPKAPENPHDPRAASKRRSPKKDAEAAGTSTGRPLKGAKASGKRGAWAEDPELSDELAATDTYSGDQIVLDELVREFIVLEFPMFPLREDLRSSSDQASSPLPSGAEASQQGGWPDGRTDGERPLDPRLLPLAELKSHLEKKE